MTQLEKNLAALPVLCYSVLNTTGELIIIKRGVSGYFPTEGYTQNEHCTFEQQAAIFNERMGVTPAQRLAMDMGSIFGWDIPGAHPDAHADRVAA
jgi:hypothetical protein